MVLRHVTGRVSKAELLCVNKADSRVRKKEVKIEADKDVSDTRIMKFVTKALFDDMREGRSFDIVERCLMMKEYWHLASYSRHSGKDKVGNAHRALYMSNIQTAILSMKRRSLTAMQSAHKSGGAGSPLATKCPFLYF